MNNGLPPSPSPIAGFTLIEVLTALAVLAITLGVMIRAAAQQADNLAYLRDRTLAHWVAMNQITQRQILHEWPNAGQYTGEEEMGGHPWHWRLTISPTPEEQIRRMTVHVAASSDPGSAPLVQLEAFLAQP